MQLQRSSAVSRRFLHPSPGHLAAILNLLTVLAAISASAALADGNGAVWGYNAGGLLGDGSTTNLYAPTALDTSGGLSGKTVLQVSAQNTNGSTSTSFFSCAVTTMGAAYCWGSNGAGQLGNGTITTTATVPTPVYTSGVLKDKNVVQVAVGGDNSAPANGHACALTSDGLVYCWGSNGSGELGDNNIPNNSSVPVAVNTSGALSGKKVVQIAAGYRRTCAVTGDGLAACWGDNSSGSLGIGSTSPSNSGVPVLVTTASGALSGKLVKQIATGTLNTCAVTADGAAVCWGSNTVGRNGNGVTTSTSLTPVAVLASATYPALYNKEVMQISMGASNACAVPTDGVAACWGSGSTGGLGNGSNSLSSSPVLVSTAAGSALNGKKVAQIGMSGNNTCAALTDGTVSCWGVNATGQLGIGSADALIQNTPLAVTSTSSALAGRFVTQVAAGAANTSSNYGYAVAAAPGGGAGRDIPSKDAAVWQAMALPCAPTGTPSVSDIFGGGSPMNLTTSDYNTGDSTAYTGWTIMRFNAASNQFETLAASAKPERGRGYFLFTYQQPRQNKLLMNCPTAAPPATVTDAQGCASANGCFAIPLTSASGADRYNLLGNPFPYAVDLANVRIRVDGNSTSYTLSQAAGTAADGNLATPLVASSVYVWNGTSYAARSDSGATAGSLPYFGSFWLQVLAAASDKKLELLVPALPTGSAKIFAGAPAVSQAGRVVQASAPVKPVVRQPAVPATWSLRLRADDYARGWSFEGAWLGRQKGASASYDSQDVRALAPLSAPYLYLAFPHADWGAKAADYLTDFRPPATGIGAIIDWPFELRASKLGSTVYLRRDGDSEVLRHSRLIDVATGAAIPGDDPRWQGQGIPLTVSADRQKYIWRYTGP